METLATVVVVYEGRLYRMLFRTLAIGMSINTLI